MTTSMAGSVTFAPLFRRALALLAVACSALLLAGCAWTGEGRDVAAALKSASDIKAAEFQMNAEFKMSGMPAGVSNAPDSMSMTMSGAIDENDPAHPRSWFDMNVANMMKMKMLEPGDGYGYIVVNGKPYGMPEDPSAKQASQPGTAKIFDLLGSAIGGFKSAAASTTADGESLKTVYAKADAGKLCGKVLPAFLDVAKTAAAASGGIGGFGGSGQKLAANCSKMLSGDPQLWFGIDSSGMLRKVTLKVDIAVPGSPVKMSMTMYIDFKPVKSIDPVTAPAGATILHSQHELAQELLKSMNLGSGFSRPSAG